MRDRYREFSELNTVILVVGPGQAADYRAHWQRDELPFTALPDPGGDVLGQYGQDVQLLKLGRMPAAFVIDQRGIIVLSRYGRSMADLPTADELLETLRTAESSGG